MADRYSLTSKLVYVKMYTKGKTVANYAFRTNLEDTSGSVLGHVSALKDGVLLAGIVIGANSPKPFRATKEAGGTKGSESSYISNDKISTARGSGWTISAPRYKSAPISTRSKLVYVETKVGAKIINYGWPMPDYQYAKIGTAGLTALGITLINTTTDIPEQEAFFGVNVPRPGRASKRTQVTTGQGEAAVTSSGGLITTFVSDNKADDAIAAGWRVRSKTTVQRGYLIPSS